MTEEAGEKISFRFTGGLADQGELDFLELGRSQYAAGRLLNTLGIFAQTGRVVQKVHRAAALDIRARAPKDNCFQYEALLFIAQQAAATGISVPLNVLFTMVWENLVPATAGWITTKREAELEVKRLASKERVGLAKEETAQLDIARRIKEEEEEVTNREAIKFLNKVLKDQEVTPGSSEERKTTIRFAVRDLKMEVERQKILEPYEKELAKIDAEDRRKLLGKSRQALIEVGLPVRGRSADELFIMAGANDNPVGWLDNDRVTDLEEMVDEPEIDLLRGTIIQFNTKNGYGRFTLHARHRNEYGNEISFRVPREKILLLQDRILDSMKESDDGDRFQEITGEFLITTDKFGNIRQLELTDVLDGVDRVLEQEQE